MKMPQQPHAMKDTFDAAEVMSDTITYIVENMAKLTVLYHHAQIVSVEQSCAVVDEVCQASMAYLEETGPVMREDPHQFCADLIVWTRERTEKALGV